MEMVILKKFQPLSEGLEPELRSIPESMESIEQGRDRFFLIFKKYSGGTGVDILIRNEIEEGLSKGEG